jgi:magnesium chelatase family protein
MFGKVWTACVLGIDGHMIEVEVDLANGLPQVNVVGLPDTAVRESVERVRAAVKNCGYSFPMERVTVNLAPADVRKEGASYDLAIALCLLVTSGQLRPGTLERSLIIGELALDGTLRPVPGVLAMVHHAREKGFRRIILPAANAKEALLIEGINVLPLEHLNGIRRLEEGKAESWEGVRISERASDGGSSSGGSSAGSSGGSSGSTSAGTFGGSSVGTSAGSSGGSSAGSSPGCSTGTSAGCSAGSSGSTSSSSGCTPENTEDADASQPDYADIFGQLHAKRALMIAAAGFHNLILIGPPGTGKTMLIRRLPTILPEMSDEEALATTKIYSVAGKLTGRAQLLRTRPFRAPHHTVSSAGLIGGGSVPKPGEVSLAHHGVLFLDELPEFSRTALEVLRQPLEDKSVTIGRARAVFSFPAHFMLAASMNPCPCGYYGGETGKERCTCSPVKIAHYRSRISGPLLDRIDLHVEVPRVDFSELAEQSASLSSAGMKNRVMSALSKQARRYATAGIRCNGELAGRMLRTHCRLQPEAETMLRQAFQELGLSVRAHDRILKIARTIADLEDSEQILTDHMAEAITYRSLDRKM